MAVLLQGGVSFLWNIRVLLLWIHISSIWVINSQGTFILRNPEENEVIFVGETITLECRAPINVGNPQFRLLDSQDSVVVDYGFSSSADGHVGYPGDGGANFQINIKFVSQTRYSCEISGDENILTAEEIYLNVYPRMSPVCFVNTTTGLTNGEVVGLSCYHEIVGVSGSNIKWRQVLRDGTVNEQLPLEYSSLINSFKRKLSTYIRASSADDGSEFECVIMDSGSEKTCTSGEISVQQNQEVELMFSPEISPPLDRGDLAFVTCSSSDSNHIVSWRENTGYQKSEVTVTFIETSILVVVPEETTLMTGTVLNFVCMASSEGNIVFRVLTLNVIFASNTAPSPTTIMATTTATTQPTQVMLAFSPDTVPPLDRGDAKVITCSSSVSEYNISWMTTVGDAEAIVTTFGNAIFVTIPMNTTLVSGDILIFSCLATFNEVTVSRQLILNVVFASTTKRPSTTSNVPIPPSTPIISTISTSDSFMTSQTDENMTTSDVDDESDSDGGNDSDGGVNAPPKGKGTDFTIYIVIAVVVVVVMVAVISVILIAICMTKQQDYSSKEERKFENAAYDSHLAEEANTGYSSMDRSNRNGPSALPGPDVVPYSDVSRGSHIVEIDEDEIYDDSKDWKGSREL